MGRKLGRDGSPERTPENDDPRRIQATLGNEVLPGRLRIPVRPLLAGFSFALAVATVIDDERIEPEFVKDRDAVETVRYVARVAVQK